MKLLEINRSYEYIIQLLYFSYIMSDASPLNRKRGMVKISKCYMQGMNIPLHQTRHYKHKGGRSNPPFYRISMKERPTFYERLSQLIVHVQRGESATYTEPEIKIYTRVQAIKSLHSHQGEMDKAQILPLTSCRTLCKIAEVVLILNFQIASFRAL